MLEKEGKLLFFDIDGTLLYGLPGTVPESTKEALRKAQEKGHYLFINTGRTRVGLPASITDLSFDGYICGCGTQIIFKEEELFHSCIPEDRYPYLMKLLKDANMQGIFESPTSIYYEDRPDRYPAISEILRYYIANPDPGVFQAVDAADLSFDKFVVGWDKTSDLQAWKKAMEEDYEIISQEDAKPIGFIEIVQKNLSKASGIDYIVDHLGMSLDDCYVFGDSNNDLPMLTHVKNSIAMGNSTKEVLEVSSYVTTPILREGIPNALKHFHLI